MTFTSAFSHINLATLNQAIKIMSTLLVIACSLAVNASAQIDSNNKDGLKRYAQQAKYELLETSRSSALIYEVVNIRFNAKMIDSREYLEGFTPIFDNEHRDLRNSYKNRSFARSQLTATSRPSNIIRVREFSNTGAKLTDESLQKTDDLMLTDVEILNIHHRVIMPHDSFALSRDPNTSNDSAFESLLYQEPDTTLQLASIY